MSERLGQGTTLFSIPLYPDMTELHGQISPAAPRSQPSIWSIQKQCPVQPDCQSVLLLDLNCLLVCRCRAPLSFCVLSNPGNHRTQYRYGPRAEHLIFQHQHHDNPPNSPLSCTRPPAFPASRSPTILVPELSAQEKLPPASFV
jgi:hypothetical protein